MKITFEKEAISQDVPTGRDFQHMHAVYPHLPLRFGCRRGECSVCVLYIVKGMENLTQLTREEARTLKLKSSPPECRLACQCAVNGDVTVGSFQEA